MSNNPYTDFRFGIDTTGYIEEIINSEDSKYSGSGFINPGAIIIENIPQNNMPYSFRVNLAPLGSCIFKVNKSLNN